MAKYNTPYKYVLEGIQDAIDMGYLSEDRKTWWLQCSWHINGEDIICFFEVLQMLKIDVFRRMGARPVVIEYTEGEEENNVEEIGFDGGYKISSEKFPPIYIGWYAGPGALAKELVPVTRLATKDSAMPFIESKKRNLKESQIEEEYTRTIESALEDANIYTQELYVYEDEMGVLHAQFDLSGDWKHQHMLAKNIMKELGWQKDVENVEDSGEDYYFAHYEFINIASAQKSVSARSSEGHLVTESKSKKAKKEARVSNFDLSPYDLRNQIKSYVRGRLYDLVGADGAKNFKINQPKWDMIYDGSQGGTSFAIRTQGEDYYMSTFINSSLNWQGKGFEEFKTDFEDLVQESFKQL